MPGRMGPAGNLHAGGTERGYPRSKLVSWVRQIGELWAPVPNPSWFNPSSLYNVEITEEDT